MFITTPCPQCGGEIEFLDEAQAIKCSYCGSQLHLTGTDEDRRYYLEPRTTEKEIKIALQHGFRKKKGLCLTFTSSRLMFFPYWWVKGMVFKWILGKDEGEESFKVLKTRLLDYTFPAHTIIPIGPPTLGIRTSTMRVRAFNNQEMQKVGSPLKVTLPHAKAVEYAEGIKDFTLTMGDDISIEMEKTGLIGERYALIYFPVWGFSIETPQGSAELFVDGLSLSVIRPPHQQGPILPLLNEDAFTLKLTDIGFIPLRCPVCGWDLPFHPYNVIHLCSICGRAWCERKGSFEEIAYQVVKCRTEPWDRYAYLPFWLFHVTISTPAVTLTSMADFYQYFPVPRAIDQEKEKRKPIRFYIPAFRIKNIPVVSKFSTTLTHNQPAYDYGEKETLLRQEIGDVFLNASEAREMAELVLYALVPKASGRAKKLIAQATLQFREEQLAWFPFMDKGNSYLAEITGYALQKNAIEIH